MDDVDLFERGGDGPLTGVVRWSVGGPELAADPATLRLLRHDPFAGRRPALIRVRTFRYRFATRAERRADGSYWVREGGRTVIGPVAARG